MFLGITAQVQNWNAEGNEFSLVLEENPITDFVELPEESNKLWYKPAILIIFPSFSYMSIILCFSFPTKKNLLKKCESLETIMIRLLAQHSLLSYCGLGTRICYVALSGEHWRWYIYIYIYLGFPLCAFAKACNLMLSFFSLFPSTADHFQVQLKVECKQVKCTLRGDDHDELRVTYKGMLEDEVPTL